MFSPSCIVLDMAENPSENYASAKKKERGVETKPLLTGAPSLSIFAIPCEITFLPPLLLQFLVKKTVVYNERDKIFEVRVCGREYV